MLQQRRCFLTEVGTWSLMFLFLVCFFMGGPANAADSGDVTITWYGHSMFTLVFAEGPTVLTDPFEPGVWGISYPVSSLDGIDVVLVSHEHEDHNYVALATGSPVMLRGQAPTPVKIDRTIDGIRFYSVETCHTPETTCAREMGNSVFVMEGHGLRIAHLGDLGHVLTSAQAEAIGKVDVLFVPVGGGGPTVDASGANAILALLEPQVIIAMHYETPALGWGLDPIDPFLLGKTVAHVTDRELTINATALPTESTVFVLRYE